MTNATRRGRALGSGSIAVAVLLSACATTENGKVMEADMNLTRAQAQAKVIEYLTETIAVLPPGAYLTRYSELSKKVTLSPGGVVPCNDSNLSKDTSVDYGVMYFLESSDAASIPSFGDTIRSLWTERGWKFRTYDSAGDTTSTETILPDGYRMVFDEHPRGAGLSGSSPCFSRPEASDHPNAPVQIDQP
ncbi:hypothetical protein I7X09_14925 [Rhodococcus sp. P-2]|uniref:hypothetical protein n=1 Tax=Rhodococcus sp. P-2 TaxID=2795031 RepID=UPI001908BF95|nr:hypothetical protein [Rhodococcus sp. P-2]QQM24662.1 hypothetical protein I7X09_14925 [Rhodococcus sp. P-2]